jgi:hypothetical protein
MHTHTHTHMHSPSHNLPLLRVLLPDGAQGKPIGHWLTDHGYEPPQPPSGPSAGGGAGSQAPRRASSSPIRKPHAMRGSTERNSSPIHKPHAMRGSTERNSSSPTKRSYASMQEGGDTPTALMSGLNIVQQQGEAVRGRGVHVRARV